MTKRVVVLGALLIGGAALAMNLFHHMLYARGGITIGATGTGISDSYSGSGIYDFPSLTGTHTSCLDSAAITVTGAAFGDVCSVGIDQALPTDALINCHVSAANAVKVRACASGIEDGGEVDIPDASYYLRVFDP
jgi:hypothetical protein